MKNTDPERAWRFAKRVRARLYYLKIKPGELAEISGISRSTLYLILKGDHIPNDKTLEKLAFGLAMTTDELIQFTI